MLRAHRTGDEVEFLASTDVWFRPCNFANAPDGNLYFTDIYRQVIETPESIPEEIRKKINFYNGDTLGRIYRIACCWSGRMERPFPNFKSWPRMGRHPRLACTHSPCWTRYRRWNPEKLNMRLAILMDASGKTPFDSANDI